MKILIFSDLHLHNWSYGSTVVNGMNSRLMAQADVLNQIADAATQVDYIVFCGDLFHTHGKLDADVLKVAYDGFLAIAAKSSCDIDVLVGNHDTNRKDLGVHSLHWLNSLAITPDEPRIRVVSEPDYTHLTRWNSPDLKLSILPYTEDKYTIKQFFKNAEGICFMHQGVANVPMGSGFLIDEILTKEMIPDRVQHVFTGHYHQHNRVSDKLTVIGSTMQHTWNDVGDKRGWLIYDTDSGEITQHESKAPQFKHLDMTGLLSLGDPHRHRSDLQLKTSQEVNNNFVRVHNYDTKYVNELRVEMMEAGARSVEFVQQKEAIKRIDMSGSTGGFHLPTIVESYIKNQGLDEQRSSIGRDLMK